MPALEPPVDDIRQPELVQQLELELTGPAPAAERILPEPEVVAAAVAEPRLRVQNRLLHQ